MSRVRLPRESSGKINDTWIDIDPSWAHQVHELFLNTSDWQDFQYYGSLIVALAVAGIAPPADQEQVFSGMPDAQKAIQAYMRQRGLNLPNYSYGPVYTSES